MLGSHTEYPFLAFYNNCCSWYYNKCKGYYLTEEIKMNRRQALEDLFLAVRNDLLNKGVSKKNCV